MPFCTSSSLLHLFEQRKGIGKHGYGTQPIAKKTTKRAYFDHLTVWAALIHWSKYITHNYNLRIFFCIFLNILKA